MTEPTSAVPEGGARRPAGLRTTTGIRSGHEVASGALSGAMPGAMAGIVRGIDHIGIAVRDLDAALAAYSGLFGARVVHDEVNEDQGVREVMLAIGPTGDTAVDSGVRTGKGTRLQLLASLRDDSPVASYLHRRGEGVQHVAYVVRDIVAACSALRDRGVRPIYDEPRPGTAGSRVNFVHPHDAHGVLVELVQPAGRPAVAADVAGTPGR